jgi:pectinesterase
MIKPVFLVLAILLLSVTAKAQMEIPKDTSFTTNSAYLKEKKKYPDIEIAVPLVSKNIVFANDISYKNLGYRNLNLDITYPKKKSKEGYPVVILIFGGGWKSGDKAMCKAQASYLANNGYVAVAVDYRLSLESKYPAAVQDIKEAIRWVRTNAKKYPINPYKIAVLGVSAGGQLAALVGNSAGERIYQSGANLYLSDEVQAVIDIDGVLAFHHPESEEGAVAAEWLGGTYVHKPQNWEEASALSHVNSQSPPILFLNSANPRFHAGQNDMIKKLNEFNIYSEVHLFPNTPHTFWLFHPWFNDAMKNIVQFLDKVLK